MIHKTNCAKYEEEMQSISSEIKTVKLALSKRLVQLSQLEEIDLESQDEKQLEQLTRDFCDQIIRLKS